MSSEATGKKLGLVLGGGGARGAAHIGVLMELEKRQLRPDVLAGTSAGGLVAALVACGLTAAEIADFWQGINLKLFALASKPTGLLSPEKFADKLTAVIGRPTFADLQRPLALVATNLANHHEVVLIEGDLISAILATIAYPILFPPVERNGLTLIDGGVVNNVPFDIARAHGATHVIAVELGNAEPFQLPGENASTAGKVPIVGNMLARLSYRQIWQVVTAVSDIIVARGVQARLGISQPDILLRPQMGRIGLFDFKDYETAMAAGRQVVAAQNEQIKALQKLLVDKTPVNPIKR